MGRADVWVFDAAALGTALGGVPLRIVTLFGDTPRALTVSPDGSTVYAAVFKSGNRTTALSEGAVCDGFAAAAPCVVDGVSLPGGLPGPGTNHQGKRAPETALIVKYDPSTRPLGGRLGRDWSAGVLFDLPDHDVFAIDAGTLAETTSFSGVGTTLFNMAVNPLSGAVYVSNTEARNEVRFEGPGVFGGSTVQGDLAEARITVLAGGGVTPHRLNTHIDYAQRPAPAGVKAHSLSTPVGMAVSPDGATVYVAAFGSGRIGVLRHGGAGGRHVRPDHGQRRLHLPHRRRTERPRARRRAREALRAHAVRRHGRRRRPRHPQRRSQRVALHNPEPPHVVEGRPFLYDAVATSSNGEASCASCHIFGDMDDLGWDLGNPDDDVKTNPIPINLGIGVGSGLFPLPSPINGTGVLTDFHPMKGPMTTQTLRGLHGSGAMHWRGDRSNPPGTAGSAFDEVVSFNNFNVAFPGLLGRESELDPADMQRFTDFALAITLPPNPVRALDNSLTPAQARGRAFFVGPRLSDGIAGSIFGQQLGFACEGCHRLQPELGHFGTDGRASFENEVQIIKIPHLRNLYQKVGMFGMLDVLGVTPLNTPPQGPQVRGFGFLHDGSVDTLFRFFNANVFRNDSVGGPNAGFQNDSQRRDMEQFMLAFDSNLAPVVGQQITLDATNTAAVGSRIDLLLTQATEGACDLAVKGVLGGEARGWLWRTSAGGAFLPDRATETAQSDGQLRAQAAAPGQALTYTCVPPGSGRRVGIDRDEDGFLDRDEIDAGTDPADPASFPGAFGLLVPTRSLMLTDGSTPSKRRVTFKSSTRDLPVGTRILPPAPGSSGDPTAGGAVLTVYNAAGLTNDAVVVTLPATGWTTLGKRTPKGWRFKGPDGSPIRTVVVKADTITVRGGKAAWTYTLDEAAQGRVGVRLRLGGDDGWCADAPAQPGSDRPSRFKAVPKTPAPAACPPLPGGGSPSGAFVD